MLIETLSNIDAKIKWFWVRIVSSLLTYGFFILVFWGLYYAISVCMLWDITYMNEWSEELFCTSSRWEKIIFWFYWILLSLVAVLYRISYSGDDVFNQALKPNAKSLFWLSIFFLVFILVIYLVKFFSFIMVSQFLEYSAHWLYFTFNSVLYALLWSFLYIVTNWCNKDLKDIRKKINT